MRALERFKAQYHGSSLARIWHRYAPPLTIGKRYHGVKVYMDLRDNVDDLTRGPRELEYREGMVTAASGAVDGVVWDVGANVGLFAVRAALLRRRCIAFEISPKACRLMEKTRRRNALSIEIVNRAFTAEPLHYDSPRSSSAENELTPNPQGAHESYTFRTAAEAFGLPKLIKMDIEGGEAAFFQSLDFKQWLLSNRIAWLVEVHDWKLGYLPEWADVPHQTLHSNIVLYAPDGDMLNEMIRRMKALES